MPLISEVSLDPSTLVIPWGNASWNVMATALPANSSTDGYGGRDPCDCPIHRQDLFAEEMAVRFRKFFRRLASTQTEPSADTGIFQHGQASAEELTDLEEAWADLNQAANEAGVITFRACTRDGSRWQNDPEAVRMVMAMIRDSHNQDKATAIGSDRT